MQNAINAIWVSSELKVDSYVIFNEDPSAPVSLHENPRRYLPLC